jgi:hypothetical protein
VSVRVAMALWLLLGVLVWNGFFDLYISRGAREYLQLAAESELGRRPTPSMADVMSHAKHAGAIAATGWAIVIVGAGWMTVARARSSSKLEVRSSK